MSLLYILQHNAEWMCAIAITLFTATQCGLSYQQNMQNIRMKRLDLANEFDKVANCFLAEREEAIKVAEWLTSNASNFIFLLNTKDRKAYNNLLIFLFNYRKAPAITSEQKEEAIRKFFNLVSELDSALGNARYGLVCDKKEFKTVSKI
jgi:hypothetical protein